MICLIITYLELFSTFSAAHMPIRTYNWLIILNYLYILLSISFFFPGSPAEKALNVFYYCTYEGAVDLDAIGKKYALKQ